MHHFMNFKVLEYVSLLVKIRKSLVMHVRDIENFVAIPTQCKATYMNKALYQITHTCYLVT